MRKNILGALPILLAILWITALNYPAGAQQYKPLTLDESIKLALDSNLKAKSAAYNVDVQRTLKGASWDIPKTSLDGQYGQFNSYSDDNSIELSQSLAFPTVYIYQSKLAQANFESSVWQLKSAQLEIATEVRQVYIELSYLYSKRDLLIILDSLYDDFVRAAELRASTGETNKLEMITARSQSLNVKNQILQVNTDITINLKKLQEILNTDKLVIPADTLLKRLPFTPPLDSMGIMTNPGLWYMRQQAMIAGTEQKLERNQMLPDLTFSYMNQSMIGTQDIDGASAYFGPGDRFNSIHAGITLPVVFGPSLARIKAAGLKEQAANTDAEYYEKSLKNHYKSLLQEYGKYSASVDYFEQQALPEADMIISQSTLSYKAGALDYTDYVTMLERAVGIFRNYLDALYNYNKSVISLEYITGKIFEN
jgi:heavy metal efflux system protein